MAVKGLSAEWNRASSSLREVQLSSLGFVKFGGNWWTVLFCWIDPSPSACFISQLRALRNNCMQLSAFYESDIYVLLLYFFFVISLFGLNRTALKASITDFDNGIWIIGLVPHWTSLVFYLLDHTCIQIMISDFDLCTQKGEYLFWSWYFWLTVVLNQRVRWGVLFVLFRCTVATIVHVAGPLILIWRESKYAVFRFQTPVT